MKYYVGFVGFYLMLWVIFTPIINWFVNDTFSYQTIRHIGFVSGIIITIIVCYIYKNKED